jgi:hypothetical protein
VPDDRTLQQDGCKNTRNGGNFIYCLDNDLKGQKVQICFVLIGRETDHPYIKKHLDKMGVVS